MKEVDVKSWAEFEKQHRALEDERLQNKCSSKFLYRGQGRPISRRLGSGSSPHFQIRVVDEAGTDYRVAVNVKSRLAPSELMYHIKSHFVHPLTALSHLSLAVSIPLPASPRPAA
ncbi:MAG: DUF2278 family protein [Chromatiales bacterium]